MISTSKPLKNKDAVWYFQLPRNVEMAFLLPLSFINIKGLKVLLLFIMPIYVRDLHLYAKIRAAFKLPMPKVSSSKTIKLFCTPFELEFIPPFKILYISRGKISKISSYYILHFSTPEWKFCAISLHLWSKLLWLRYIQM